MAPKTNTDAQVAELKHQLEHFHQAGQVALEIIGELIPKVPAEEQYEIHHRLGVVEDILTGASERYTK